MYELDILSGVETINGIEFTPAKTVGGSAKGLTHHGYTDPRDGQYKVCRMDESLDVASEITATQLPCAESATIDVEVNY